MPTESHHLPFGDVIQAALEKRKRTRVWLSEETGIPYSTLSDRFGRDEPRLSAHEFFSILKALDLTLTDFLALSPSDKWEFDFVRRLREDTRETLLAKMKAIVEELEKRPSASSLL